MQVGTGEIQPGEVKAETEEEEVGENTVSDLVSLIGELFSWGVGVLFGRWDIRFAIGEKQPSASSDPFAPLPCCPPGMLQKSEGLPAGSEDISPNYPLRISWPGILVDDPGHPEDVDTRLRDLLKVIWRDRTDDIYHEAVEILDPGADDLRQWFRRNFFDEHISQYSKSRRKAPIYWCIGTPSGSYSVWLYYHRFTKDTLYKVLNDFVKPKVEHEERKLTALRQEAGPIPTKSQGKDIEAQEIFVSELKSFRDEVARVAPMWNPSLNDGVLINFAPLWRLVSLKSWQKECKAYWDGLVAGEYDWSHLAMHIWPERVVPKCATDRSLAIAHDVEDLFWEEDDDGKWVPIKRKKDEIEDIVVQRTSRHVKTALAELLSTRGQAEPRRKIKTKS